MKHFAMAGLQFQMFKTKDTRWQHHSSKVNFYFTEKMALIANYRLLVHFYSEL